MHHLICLSQSLCIFPGPLPYPTLSLSLSLALSICLCLCLPPVLGTACECDQGGRCLRYRSRYHGVSPPLHNPAISLHGSPGVVKNARWFLSFVFSNLDSFKLCPIAAPVRSLVNASESKDCSLTRHGRLCEAFTWYINRQ